MSRETTPYIDGDCASRDGASPRASRTTNPWTCRFGWADRRGSERRPHRESSARRGSRPGLPTPGRRERPGRGWTPSAWVRLFHQPGPDPVVGISRVGQTLDLALGVVAIVAVVGHGAVIG